MKILPIRILIFVGILFLGAQNIQSKNFSTEKMLTAQINKDKITVGEKIKLTVTLLQFKGSRSDKIKIYPLPLLSDRIGEFTIKEYEILQNKSTPDSDIQTIVYTITIYRTGLFTIPSIKFHFNSDKEDVKKTIESVPILVEVVSLITNEITPALDDVKSASQIEKKLNPTVYYLMGGFIFICLLVMAYVLYRLFRKKPPVPFYILVLRQLKILETQLPLKKEEKAKSFYYKFYELARKFLSEKEKNFQIEKMTTFQFTRFCKKNRLENSEFYINFFHYADRIKFTHLFPDNQETKKHLTQFRSLVTDYQQTMESREKLKKS